MDKMTDVLTSLVPDIEYYIYRRCHVDWVILSSVIEFHDLSYIMSGEGVYLINGVEYPVAAGDVIYVPPGSERQAWTAYNNPMKLYASNFHLFAFNGVTNSSILPFGYVNYVGHDPKLINLYAQLTRVWTGKEALYQLDARAMLVCIINELARRLCLNKPINHIDKRIERIKDFIGENFHKPLSMTAMAEMVGLSPVYLGVLFSRHEACSVHEYINKVRINHAHEILQTEKLSIKEIAYSCGFTDPFYFSRMFKKYRGISPSDVRRCL